jgi:hypothetical protein
MEFKIYLIKHINNAELKNIWINFENNYSVPPAFNYQEIADWWNSIIGLSSPGLGIKRELFILILYRNNLPVCILPLVSVTRRKFNLINITTLEFISQQYSTKVFDIIGNNPDKEELDYLFNYIKNNIKFHYIKLINFSKESSLYKSYSNNCHFYSIRVFLDLNNTYPNIKKNYSVRLKGKLNSFYNSLKRNPDLLKIEITTDYTIIQNYFSKILQLKHKKEISLERLNFQEIERYTLLFFENLKNNKKINFLSYVEKDSILYSFLYGYIENKIIYQLDTACIKDKSHSLKVGFGILAFDKLIQTFSENDLILDFGFGFSDYKFYFTKNYEKVFCLLFAGKGIFSNLVYFYHLIRVKKNINKFENILKTRIRTPDPHRKI